MPKCYLDHASTTRYKPPQVYEAIMDTMKNNGCSPGRGSYRDALQAGRIVLNSRKLVAQLFNVPDVRQVVFTPGITWSINMCLRGLLQTGDHVITTSMEHNAMSRPLRSLSLERGVDITWLQANRYGEIDLAELESQIKPQTRVIAINHGSNTIGTILPLDKISAIAQRHHVFLIVDCAQTAGYCDIDFNELKLDVLAFTGHKALLGPPGTGGMILSTRASQAIRPIIAGGTGSHSDYELQPEKMPEKFESGTTNTPGIAGLGAGIQYLLDQGLATIRNHEQQLLKVLVAGLETIEGVTVWRARSLEQQVPTLLIAIEGLDMGMASLILDDRFGIMTRSGIHCSPLSHQTIGSYPHGGIRLSIGWSNTLEDIQYALDCIRQIAAEERENA